MHRSARAVSALSSLRPSMKGVFPAWWVVQVGALMHTQLAVAEVRPTIPHFHPHPRHLLLPPERPCPRVVGDHQSPRPQSPHLHPRPLHAAARVRPWSVSRWTRCRWPPAPARRRQRARSEDLHSTPVLTSPPPPHKSLPPTLEWFMPEIAAR